MRYLITLLITIVFTTSSIALEIVTYESRVAKAKDLPTSHTVQASDNVYSIAREYQVSAGELMKVNKLSPPYYLEIGQKLKLPSAKRYRIKKGDTLYSLSRKFNVSVRDLAKLNGISKKTKLNSGNYINIPNVSFKKDVVQTKATKTVKSTPKAVKKGAFSRKKVSLKKVTPTKQTNTKTASKAQQKQKKRLARKQALKTPKSSGRFIYPVRGKIVSNFGKKGKGVRNDGINIGAKKGVSVVSADNGVVAYVGSGLKAFGNMVLIKHDKKFVTVYAHLDRVNVRVGDKVNQKQIIGTIGNTGKVKNPQLHFQIRKKRQILNPNKYLK